MATKTEPVKTRDKVFWECPWCSYENPVAADPDAPEVETRECPRCQRSHEVRWKYSLDKEQIKVLDSAPTEQLVNVLVDLTCEDPACSPCFFLLAMHPAFRKPNATPENVRLACLELLRARGA